MEHASPLIILCIVFFIGGLIYQIRRARNGAEIHVRRIPGIDAIEQALGRSFELGRPVVFTTGLTGVGPTLYACIGILKFVARKVAVFGAKIFVPCRDPEVLALTESALQQAYKEERKLSRFDPDSVRFLSTDQFAYASGYMGLVHRENAGCAFLVGEYAAESLILAEAGQQVGAMQIAGTTSNEQIPFFLTTCDYTLFGEELYAAGAFLSRDPIQVGSLRLQDLAKIALMLVIVFGIVEVSWRTAYGESSSSLIQRAVEWQYFTDTEDKN